jgi:hypothetical protein
MGDIIGLIALAALIGLVSLFVPTVPLVMWLLVYFVWTAGALFIWYHRKAPDSPEAWLVLSLCSVVGVPIGHGIATLVASMAFGGNEPGLSRTLEFTLTLICSPGLTFIAVTGWVRALALARLK